MATCVLVHGGWIWRRIGSLLRRAGLGVFTPTLNSPAVNLDTHA